jgi:hypothetical protein
MTADRSEPLNGLSVLVAVLILTAIAIGVSRNEPGSRAEPAEPQAQQRHLKPSARLPDEWIKRTVLELSRGSDAGVWRYAVPWALEINPDGSLWIEATETVHREPGGTVEMGVMCDKSGCVVDVSSVKRRRDEWRRRTVPLPMDGYLPVTRVIGGDAP